MGSFSTGRATLEGGFEALGGWVRGGGGRSCRHTASLAAAASGCSHVAGTAAAKSLVIDVSADVICRGVGGDVRQCYIFTDNTALGKGRGGWDRQ